MEVFLAALPVVLLLFGLEIVLSVDNVIVITILVSHLPDKIRNKARVIGLLFALVCRILILMFIVSLAKLRDPVLMGFSVRDFILLGGGLFLLWKAVEEIRNTIEHRDQQPDFSGYNHAAMTKIVGQIVFLDFVFSFDSVVTAIGLTDNLWIIVVAVVLSYLVILLYANPVGEYILARPTLKILALAFLVTIGVTIFLEGMHQHIPKQYIYLPMGFALFVQALQMRFEHNLRRRQTAAIPGQSQE